MGRFNLFLVLVCVLAQDMSGVVCAQTFMPNGYTIGSISTQAVLDHFKSIPNPHLYTNYSNAATVNALKAKKDAGNTYLNTIWSNLANVNVQYRPANAQFYCSLMGMTAAQRTAFADKVRGYTPGPVPGDPWSRYTGAQEFAGVLFAYDAVVSTGELSAGDITTFKSKVNQYVAVMQGQIQAPTTLGNISENVAATIGLAGLVLPNETGAYNWIDLALKLLQTAYQDISNEACIAEGPSYQVSFSLCAMVGDLLVTLEEHGFRLVNRPDDNLVERMFTWMVKTMRPDKCAVETEDCWPNTKPGGIWPAKYIQDNVEYRRALQWYGTYMNSTDDLRNYITYDLSLSATNPPQWHPTQFFPTSSCAIFRTNFEPQGTWLYFLGDRMPFFFSYGGVGGWAANKNHGHCDATSITLYAKGGYLLTESARFAGIESRFHNLIMVDNNSAEPAWSISSADKYTTLADQFATSFCDGADMTITYGATNFKRSVVFVKKLMTPAENEYFYVIDDVEAATDTNHTYELLFHNKAGNFSGTGLKTRISTTGSAAADLVFMEPDLTQLFQMDEETSGPSAFTDHRIHARFLGKSCQFITLVYPRAASTAAPAVTEINGANYRGGSFTVNNVTEIILSQKGRVQETAGNVTSDAKIVFLRLVTAGPEQYLVKQGTLLRNGTRNMLVSDVTLPVATLRYSSNTQLAGYLKLDQPANLTFYSQDGATSSWKYLDAGEYQNFSFTLATGGTVQGRVTDQNTGLGIGGVRVEAVQGADTAYCYSNAAGNYQFLWVRPATTTFRFVKGGYTTATTTQAVTGGQTLALDQVLTITTANPVVLNASVTATTNTSATIRIATDKLCLNQVSYGTTTAYGAQTVKTSVYKDADTITINGLTAGTRYHFQARVWDYGNRQGVSVDQEFVPVGEFRDDFNDNTYAGVWTTTSALWAETGGVLRKTSGGNYAYTPQRPKDLVLAQGMYYGSFTLTTRLRSLRASDLRDACVVFNYQDSTHFYYANFSMTAGDQANGIFMVNGIDRVKVGTAGAATLNGENWADIKIVRDLKNGAITVYAGSMTTPAFTWTDYTFGLGQIGLGSERSVVEFDSIHVWPTVIGGTAIYRMPQGNRILPTISIIPNPLVARSTHLEIGLGAWEQQRPGLMQVTINRPDGTIVKSLLDQYGRQAPERLVWDKTDGQGRPVEAGVYLVQVRQGSRSESIRVLVLK